MISDIASRSLDAMNAYKQAYRDTQAQAKKVTSANAPFGTDSPGTGNGDTVTSFTTALDNAIKGSVQTGRTAETQTARGLSGGGNMSEIATSVEEAKLTLQTVTTIRDRMVQAWQEVMRMSV